MKKIGCVGHNCDEFAELKALMAALLVEIGEDDCNDGNAPGHGHEIPGIWDSDNGKKAGKPCAWCATWAKAKAMGLMTPNVEVTGAARLYRAASG